jgi:hypothetical protein
VDGGRAAGRISESIGCYAIVEVEDEPCSRQREVVAGRPPSRCELTERGVLRTK